MAELRCPRCGSIDVDVQVHQENRGSVTKTKTKSLYKQKGHGILWWLLIGWWWWIVDLFLWLCFFIPRLLVQIFKKKKYVGKSKSTSVTHNNISYQSICICKSCGHNWRL